MTPQIGDIWQTEIRHHILRASIPVSVLLIEPKKIEMVLDQYGHYMESAIRWNVLVLDTGEVTDILERFLKEQIA